LERRQDAPNKGIEGGNFTDDCSRSFGRPGNGAASLASLKPGRDLKRHTLL